MVPIIMKINPTKFIFLTHVYEQLEQLHQGYEKASLLMHPVGRINCQISIGIANMG